MTITLQKQILATDTQIRTHLKKIKIKISHIQISTSKDRYVLMQDNNSKNTTLIGNVALLMTLTDNLLESLKLMETFSEPKLVS